MTKRISGFEYLPVETSNNSIEIYPPFSKIVYTQFNKKGLDIKYSETNTIVISFEKIDYNKRDIFLKELKSLLKDSRRQIIEDFLIYKDTGISYL